jgi:hypothetical protein
LIDSKVLEWLISVSMGAGCFSVAGTQNGATGETQDAAKRALRLNLTPFIASSQASSNCGVSPTQDEGDKQFEHDSAFCSAWVRLSKLLAFKVINAERLKVIFHA